MLRAALAARLCGRAAASAVQDARQRALRRAGSSRGLATPSDFDLLADEAGAARVDGWDETGFVVSDVQYSGAVLVYGSLTLSWRPTALAELTPDTLAPLLLLRPQPELLILGCGTRLAPPPPQLAQFLRREGIALECMDTGNAAATYNILSQEGRNVAAALLPAAARAATRGAPRRSSAEDVGNTGPFPNWRARGAG